MVNVIIEKEEKPAVTAKHSILKMLAYFSIFKYPLTDSELKSFASPGEDAGEISSALASLVRSGSVYKLDEFYSLHNDFAWVERRRAGNIRAEKLLPIAKKIGRFLAGFPYVTGIGISGSLSKMYADEKADIDFFIITKANRLWIARSFMHLFKKFTFLSGRQHYYCMNYYLDETALGLQEQNVYTAIETVTLMPVAGEGIQGFFLANDWVADWFGNYSPRKYSAQPTAKSWPQRFIEWMFDNKAGDWLDDKMMKLTTRRWQRKKQKGLRNHEGKAMDLITGKHFARSNPGMFQEKLLLIYNAKLKEINSLKS